MNNQTKAFRFMDERVRSFCSGAFGIARSKSEEDNSPMLFTEGQVYPIVYMNFNIMDQIGTVLLQGSELPPEYRILLDDFGVGPDYVRLALTRGEDEIIAVSGDASPIQGSVLIVAQAEEPEPFIPTISARFGINEGQQISSVLWDTSDELFTYFLLKSKLLDSIEGTLRPPETA